MPSAVTNSPKVNTRRTLGAAIAAAVVASICCVGPVVLIALGASGAWMSSLTALEPLRPLLILATGGFLGYAVARVYAKAAEPEVCAPGSLCADPRTDRINKAALFGVTILVAGLLMVPTFVGLADEAANEAGLPTEPAATAAPAAATQAAPVRERVVLSIENMTCAACPHNVRSALSAIDGVTVQKVTFDPPRAVVEIDTSKTNLEAVTKATADIGYPSRRTNS